MKAIPLCVFVAALTIVAFSAADPIRIEFAHGSAAEAKAADQLQKLLERFNVEPWLFTRRVMIDERAIPHSHQVLTLHTRHLDRDDLLLSTFVHEQLHWWLVSRPEKTVAAVAELRTRFPGIAVGAPDGAANELSSYEHLVVIYLEEEADRRLLGESGATEAIAFWSTDHYRELYKLVLKSEDVVGSIVAKQALTCCTASNALEPTAPRAR